MFCPSCQTDIIIKEDDYFKAEVHFQILMKNYEVKFSWIDLLAYVNPGETGQGTVTSDFSNSKKPDGEFCLLRKVS